MKRRLISNCIAVALLTAIFFTPLSCSKSGNVSQTTGKPDVELITRAYIFFQTSVRGLQNIDATNDAGDPRTLLHKYPNWDRAYIQTLSIGKAVVVPIYIKEPLFIEYNSGTTSKSANDITYLLIYGEGANKKVEVVTKIPDETFVSNKNGKTVFSGVTRVENWKGNYLRGYKYANGGIQIISSGNAFIRPGMQQGGFKAGSATTPLGPPALCGTEWFSCTSGDGGQSYDCIYTFSTPDCADDGQPGTPSGNPDNPTQTDYGQVGFTSGGGSGGGGQTIPGDQLCSSSFNYSRSSSFYLTNMSGMQFENGTSFNTDNGSVFSLNNGITDAAMNSKPGNDYLSQGMTSMQYLQEIVPDLFQSGDIASTISNGEKVWNFSVYAAQKISALAANIASIGVIAKFGAAAASKPGLNIIWQEFRTQATGVLGSLMPGSKCVVGTNLNGTSSSARYEIGCN